MISISQAFHAWTAWPEIAAVPELKCFWVMFKTDKTEYNNIALEIRLSYLGWATIVWFILLIMRFTRPCLHLWNEKRTCKWLNHSFVSNKYGRLPKNTSNDKSNEIELWKSIRLTSFQKPQLQSVSISFKFVHPFGLFYILWRVIYA